MSVDLRSIPLFSDLSEEIIQALSSMVKEEFFFDGETIFSEGSTSDAFYIIHSGEVTINKIINKEQNKTKTLAILATGDFFGEMSLIDRGPRSASAVARQEVILYSLSWQNFQEFLQSKPTAAQTFVFCLLETLVRRLRQTDNELITVYETGKIIGSFFDLKKTAQMVLERIMESIDTGEYGLVAIWNEYIEEFEIQASVNYKPAEMSVFILDIDEPIVKYLSQHKDHLLIKNLPQDDRFHITSQKPFYGTSILASPMISRDKCIGFIILTNKTKQCSFSLHQLNMLSAVAAQLSQAVENTKHIEEERARQRLQQFKET